MHELSIARSIHGIALEEARRLGVERVLAVSLRVGVLRQIVPSLLRSAFEAVSQGTPLAGAILRIALEPVRVDCAACGRAAATSELVLCCPSCGSSQIGFSGGMEMEVTSISVCTQGDNDEHYCTSKCA